MNETLVLRKTQKATIEQFTALQDAYEYFNRVLFKGKLPDVILNLSRKHQAAGFVAPFRWRNAETPKGTKGTLHELSINPEILAMPFEYIYSTLVHEQCHIWQFEYGNPSRLGYHNKQWANKMESIGLVPSDTGIAGGKKTGQQMSDYPKKDGKFLKALKKMPKKFKLPFLSTEGDWITEYLGSLDFDVQELGTSPVGEQGWAFILPKPPKSKNGKTKYTCPSCNMNLWGKPSLNVICGDCDRRLVET